MNSTSTTTDPYRSLMADLSDLAARAFENYLNGDPNDELRADLRDTLDRIDRLAEQLNGTDE